MFFIGIDIGSITTKAVIINEKKEILNYIILPSGTKHKIVAEKCLTTILNRTKVEPKEIQFTISTGYGRTNVPFANYQMTEIACHGKGAHYLYPNTQIVIDIGGQDSKVIKLNKYGKVIDFSMNDKCAAGTGRFLEVMAKALEVDLDYLSKIVNYSKVDISISNMCTVFAESEVISKISEGYNKEDIIKGLNNAVADKIVGMTKRMCITDNVTITGGVAKNYGVVKAIEEKLKIKLNIPDKPQIIGALGAALIAMEKSLEIKSKDNIFE